MAPPGCRWQAPPVDAAGPIALRRTRSAGVLALVLGSACVQEEVRVETVRRDLPVDQDDREWAPPAAGPPHLVVGVREDEGFRELEDGDALIIERGMQGGRWVHISLRTTGLRRAVTCVAALSVEAHGAPVGALEAALRLKATREGPMEAPQVPVPLEAEWEERVPDLLGRPGRLDVALSDSDGARAAGSVEVVYAER